MKTIGLVRIVGFTSVAGLLATGCVYRERVAYREPGPPAAVVTTVPPPAVASDEVVVTEAPPAPLYEVQTVAPGPGFVWVEGAWGWNGRHWSWERGHWMHPPRPGARWVRPHYEARGSVHVYVRGGWRY